MTGRLASLMAAAIWLICSGLRLRVLDAEAGQIGLGVVVGHRLVLLDVLRHVDEHRSLPAGRGDDERLLHHAGDVVHVGHQVVMLGDAAADFDDRRFLKGVGADDLGGHLAGDGDERDAVELGVGDGGDEVRGAGAAGGHAHAGLAGAAGDALGGERAALLVPRQDRAQLVA